MSCPVPVPVPPSILPCSRVYSLLAVASSIFVHLRPPLAVPGVGRRVNAGTVKTWHLHLHPPGQLQHPLPRQTRLMGEGRPASDAHARRTAARPVALEGSNVTRQVAISSWAGFLLVFFSLTRLHSCVQNAPAVPEMTSIVSMERQVGSGKSTQMESSQRCLLQKPYGAPSRPMRSSPTMDTF